MKSTGDMKTENQIEAKRSTTVALAKWELGETSIAAFLSSLEKRPMFCNAFQTES